MMPMMRPLMKKVQIGSGHYLYDAKSNRILRVTEVMYNAADLVGTVSDDQVVNMLSGKYPPKEIRKGLTSLNTLIRDFNLFSPGSLQQRVGQVTSREVASQLSQGAQSLTLEVTEACNLRCKYCIYSGGYQYMRTHGLRHMPWSIAKAALDFHLTKNDSADELAIGFYGGEPLLQFELIKRCCEYVRARERACGNSRPVRFSLTTNGTLLTPDKVDYFITNRFCLTISFDGPREIHDQYRIHAQGGGTFDIVLSWLQYVYELDPEYYDEKVLINTLVAPPSSLRQLQAFFDEHAHLFGDRLNISSVADGNPDFAAKYPAYPEYQQDFQALHEEYCTAHLLGTAADLSFRQSFVNQLFEHDYLLFHKRSILERGREQLNRVNTCVPGRRKLFVDVDGRFHICERMTRQFPIGDVWSGYDMEQITVLFNQFNQLMNSEECRLCWAVQMCPICFTVGRDGTFSQTEILEQCTTHRDKLESMLVAYCTIAERNPKAFDYFQNYTIS